MKINKESILNKAYDIVHNDRQKQYGSMIESYKKSSVIASLMICKELSPQDIVKVLIAVKITRESFKSKEDNRIDTCGYLEILNILEKEL